MTDVVRPINLTAFESSKQNDNNSLPVGSMKAAVERVEFAKEIEHVEIAVGNKGLADNVTKPVLAKSYVKDKKNDSKNTTHTIDGNFIVKYDEPLSESTTREIANNIFKAVFNTLNKTSLPSGTINGASNGVERATIEKNKHLRLTKNMLSAPLDRFQNDEDGEEGIARDKIASLDDAFKSTIGTNETRKNNRPIKEHNDSMVNDNEKNI